MPAGERARSQHDRTAVDELALRVRASRDQASLALLAARRELQLVRDDTRALISESRARIAGAATSLGDVARTPTALGVLRPERPARRDS